MATSRAFTKNLGAPIAGTAQVGNIAYTLPGSTINFAATGLKWYNGPDESDIVVGNGIENDFAGYVICVEGTTTDKDGGTSPIKFYKSQGKTEAAFIELANAIVPGNYPTGNDAAVALSNGGYFSTWETTQQQITYTEIMWYRDRNINSVDCPTMAEGQRLYLGNDNKIYWNQTASLFSTELDEGIVDQEGLFTNFTGYQTGRVYRVEYGVLIATPKNCAIL